MMSVHRSAAMTRPRQPRRKAEPVTVTRVPDVVMLAARQLIASGSYTRIEIRSASEVIVR